MDVRLRNIKPHLTSQIVFLNMFPTTNHNFNNTTFSVAMSLGLTLAQVQVVGAGLAIAGADVELVAGSNGLDQSL